MENIINTIRNEIAYNEKRMLELTYYCRKQNLDLWMHKEFKELTDTTAKLRRAAQVLEK